MSQVQVLDRSTWPVDVTSPWIEGEVRLRALCDRFGVNFAKAQDGFRDFVDDDGVCLRVPDSFRQLTMTISSLPVTSADAERGFSTMNIICTPLRNRLATSRLSNLLFASLVGPPLKDFSPMYYVNTWLLKHRAASDNQSKKRKDINTSELRYGHMVSVFV